MSSSPRIPPLNPDDCTPEQKELLVGWWQELNYVRVLAQHPDLYRAFNPLIEKTISRTKLPPRDRQVVVLRTLALCNETYETTHHVEISKNVGMSDAEIEAAQRGASTLSAFDRLLVTAAEELVRHQRIGDDTWNGLATRYSRIELMEVVGLAGAYVALAMIMKSFDIQLEDAQTFRRFQERRHYT
jgi:4-carboxymuconolactone decarboxylase